MLSMRTERIKVEPQSFGTIISSMAQGTYRIPRFQRNFVWERSRIQALLDSMYNEYPIGTIFLWKAPPRYNHMLRYVDYLQQPTVDPDLPYTFILDGQQRLTSLYVTVNGLHIRGEDYGKIVVDLANEESGRYFQYRKPDDQRWISVRDLLKEDMFALYDNLQPEFRKRFQDIRQRLLAYPFSVVTVTNMDMSDAIEIFERINQQSKSLTRYDLIAATVLTRDFDLRERSQEDIIKPLTATFGAIPETNVPQALALNISGRTEHETQIGLETAQVQRVWDRTVECLRLAVDFVQANLGVRRSDFIPYSAMLPVLAYYFFFGDTDRIKSDDHRRQLEKWFWRTAFAERYSGASQTRMTEDADRIRRLLREGEPFDFDTMPITIDDKALIQATMQSSTSAVRNGFLCMLYTKRPRHFLNGSEITIAGGHFSKFTRAERHHIFPAAVLSRSGFPSRKVHSIPNFCFIPSELNAHISDQAPSEYFEEIRLRHDSTGNFEKIMATHLIPVDENSGIWTNDYGHFLTQRARMLVTEIRRLCGTSVRMTEEQRDPALDQIEDALRDRIHEVLRAAYGSDYWKQSIPGDIQERVKTRIDVKVNSEPGTHKGQFNDPRIRLNLCDMGDYPKIIISSQNWSHFAGRFKSKQDCERMLDDLRKYRNAVKHNHEVDNLLDLRGQAAIVWIARALEVDLSQFGMG